jgi:hypothetical protein
VPTLIACAIESWADFTLVLVRPRAASTMPPAVRWSRRAIARPSPGSGSSSSMDLGSETIGIGLVPARLEANAGQRQLTREGARAAAAKAASSLLARPATPHIVIWCTATGRLPPVVVNQVAESRTETATAARSQKRNISGLRARRRRSPCAGPSAAHALVKSSSRQAAVAQLDRGARVRPARHKLARPFGAGGRWPRTVMNGVGALMSGHGEARRPSRFVIVVASSFPIQWPQSRERRRENRLRRPDDNSIKL